MKRWGKKSSGADGFSGVALRGLKGLLLILPAVLYFSYFPAISLGSDEAMNFELSLPLLWLVLFDVLGVGWVLARGGAVWKMLEVLKKRWAFLLFPLFVSLSVVWSANATRGILTAGVMWVIVIAAGLVFEMRESLDVEFRRRWLRVFFAASLVVCGWCVLQCILDVLNVPRENTLLCLGCTYRSFGFPHPNGFAIEPQFMGNLLIAPAITAGWLLVQKQKSKKLELERSRGRVFYNGPVGPVPKLQFRARSVTVAKNTSGSRFLGSNFLLFCFFIVVATLFLTFSRGAIYSFVVAMAFLTGVMAVKKCWRKMGAVWGVVILAFVFTLNLQGILAQVSPTDDTYFTGVTKVLNHLSLGTIDVHAMSAEFDGYVEESTNIRKELSRNGLEIWRRDFKTLMFGVGIGGAGEAMYASGLTGSPKEIIQNQYVSLLAETGVVGVVLLILIVVLVLREMLKGEKIQKKVAAKSLREFNFSSRFLPDKRVLMIALAVAYGVSLLFFSGLANAVHIYLLPVVLWGIF